MLPSLLIAFLTFVFGIIEKACPGRQLPLVNGWYSRAIFLNSCQLMIVVIAGFTWNGWMQGFSLLHIGDTLHPILQGALGWFIGTFVFYWWHRARHDVNSLWRVFHQIHHSPARIELLTSFYKHPAEILVNSLMISALMFIVLGSSVDGAGWFNVFAVAGEFFYHSNIRTPHWMGYFIQRPEHHSIHHQLDVHNFNFGDITLWDRLFGTFRDADSFAAQCGFPDGKEKNLMKMLCFHENYDS